MQSGDVKAMQDLMNADPNVKDLMGQDNLDKMNQFMSSSGANMMTNGSGSATSGSMMNGSGRTMMNF